MAGLALSSEAPETAREPVQIACEDRAATATVLDDPIAFVDVETTGGDARWHRVIEVAIVRVRAGVLEEEWSTLINPQCPIPPHIEALTGIDTAMVEDAPTFAEVAREVAQRLEGRLFVAHNVSFDRGFLRAELECSGHRFNPRSLCTVRLSRRLYPGAHSHALDSVIQRLGIQVQRRHRALDDAQVLWKLWQAALEHNARAELGQLVAELAGLTTLPPQLPAGLADEIPETPGVYRFYGEQRALLYVGKSRSLRTRVLAHFSNAHRNGTDRNLKTQVRDIEWTETAGELGAELAEVRCIRESQPVYNKRLKESRTVFTLRLDDAQDGGVRARIDELDPFASEPIGAGYGLFRQRADAARALRKLVREHSLCAVALGLEDGGGSCVAYQLGRCRGACMGAESLQLHATRVRLALARDRVRPWPFAGALGIRERTAGGRMDIHVFREWRYLGTARDDEELAQHLLRASETAFDVDLYRILGRYLRGKRRRLELIELERGRAQPFHPRPGAPDSSY